LPPVSDSNIIENLRTNLQKIRDRTDYPFLRSAVVVALLPRNHGLEIVLELRSGHLRRSPGEVGSDFPSQYLPAGGRSRKMTHTVYYLVYEKYLIWGLSANILVRMLELLR
jgi:hypothetical protein